jgi:hypothetical protein
MPVCEICEKEVKVAYECKECGCKFCEDCGNAERELCDDCLSYEEGAYGEGEIEVEEEGWEEF